MHFDKEFLDMLIFGLKGLFHFMFWISSILGSTYVGSLAVKHYSTYVSCLLEFICMVHGAYHIAVYLMSGT